MSPGDVIDEFAGHILHNPPQGKVTGCDSVNVYRSVDILAVKNSEKLYKWSCVTTC